MCQCNIQCYITLSSTLPCGITHTCNLSTWFYFSCQNKKSQNWGLLADRSSHSITHSHSVHFIPPPKPDASPKWAVIHGGETSSGSGQTHKNKQVMSHVTTSLTLRNVLQDYGSTCALTPSSPKAVTWQQHVTTFGT